MDDIKNTMHTLCFHSTKGGTGKTFLTNSIAYGLGKLGKKVLVIDADQQGNLTGKLLGGLPAIGLASVLMQKNTVLESIQPANPIWGSNLSVLGGGGSLLGVINFLQEQPAREVVLRNALEPIRNDYDYCLIDCPPHRDVIVFNAITACDMVYIPVMPSKDDYSGINGTLQVIETIKAAFRFPIQCGGIIRNRWGKDKLAKDISKLLESSCGSLLLKSIVPETVKVRESITNDSPLVVHSPNSPVSIAITSLVLEIFNHGKEWLNRTA